MIPAAAALDDREDGCQETVQLVAGIDTGAQDLLDRSGPRQLARAMVEMPLEQCPGGDGQLHADSANGAGVGVLPSRRISRHGPLSRLSSYGLSVKTDGG